MGAWIGLIWLRIGTDGGLFKCGYEPSGSTKGGGIFLLVEDRLASEEGLCSMDSVSK
jgi:hypothetical protein